MTKLNKAPVVHALTQIKFAPYLKMKDAIPEIQESLRHLGYIQFKPLNVQSANINIETKNVDVQTKEQWRFTHESGKECVILENDLLVLESVDYDTHKVFFESYRKVLNVVENIAELTHVTRQGLRYIDYIAPIGSIKLDGLINKELHSFDFSQIEKSKTIFSRSEHVANTEIGKLAIRCSYNYGSLVLPPGFSTELPVGIKNKTNEITAFLDIDHYIEYKNPEKMDLGKINQDFFALHNITSKAFIQCVTPEAIKAWK